MTVRQLRRWMPHHGGETVPVHAALSTHGAAPLRAAALGPARAHPKRMVYLRCEAAQLRKVHLWAFLLSRARLVCQGDLGLARCKEAGMRARWPRILAVGAVPLMVAG